MKLRRLSFFSVVFLILLRNVSGQGFVNLGFESAALVPIPSPTDGLVDFAQAFPGWTGSLGGVPVTWARTNAIPLDTAAIIIIDSNFPRFVGSPIGVIQGNYSALIVSGVSTNTRDGVDAVLSQTSLVPVSSRSLQFKAYKLFDASGVFAVTLGGQTLPLTPLGSGVNYTLYAADVTPWAGQTSQLAFTVFGVNPHVNDEYLFLDSIQFSSQIVPEPSALSCLSLVIGIFILYWRFKRLNTHPTRSATGTTRGVAH